MLHFRGDVTPELLSAILEIVERKMDHMGEPQRAKKKVFSILVECLQNLYHHGQFSEHDEENYEPSVLLMIARNAEGFSIITGNYIANQNVIVLREKLEEINQLTSEQIKSRYREILGDGQRSIKGGSGLGMIDIARKSGDKLDFGFIPFGNEMSFFCLNVSVPEKVN